jgi:hypothetical protein
MGTHYSNVQNAMILQKRSTEWAKHLIELQSEEGFYPVLVYTGMSGVGYATGLFLELYRQAPDLNVGMCYVRKEDEDSHGGNIEFNLHRDENGRHLKNRKYIFVDDFICTGESYGYAMAKTYKRFNHRFVKFDYHRTLVFQMDKTVSECNEGIDSGVLTSKFNTCYNSESKLGDD